MFEKGETNHSIVCFTLPDWVSADFVNEQLVECDYNNCRVSNTSGSLESHSAVIFVVTEGIPKVPPQNRPLGQVWVFFYMESTLFLWRHLGMVGSGWRHAVNWTMSYRLDADIVMPYGTLVTHPRPVRQDYHRIYTRKTKFAAWFVSNCNADSGRDQYVQTLKENGIPVDIYGKCGELGVRNASYLAEALNNDYMFYFAFENSLCPDYITEKLFNNFRLDVVVVVRGGADYDKLLPSDAFINAANYSGPKELAEHLMAVSSDEQMYTSYLKAKNMYEVVSFPWKHSFCRLCELLNNKEEHRHVYDDVNDYLYESDHSCQECRQTNQPSVFYLFTLFVICTAILFTCILLKFTLQYIKGSLAKQFG